MMRDDFCAFILSHGRPDRVLTYKTLRAAGYTGRIYIVIDDEDKSADKYRERYGEEVIQFSKAAMDGSFDLGDNFKKNRATVIYARNACWEIAKRVGCRYYIELDDDYGAWYYRYDRDVKYGSFAIRKTLDGLFVALVEFLKKSNALSVALSQGGDHIGGQKRSMGLLRKVMNSFVCDTSRPFFFCGRMNDDVNTYVTHGKRGSLMFTTEQAQLGQAITQAAVGGLTEMYLDVGTYVKSFYSVMYEPSCVKVSTLQDGRGDNIRIHHKVNWNSTAPKIIREKFRKATNGST